MSRYTEARPVTYIDKLIETANENSAVKELAPITDFKVEDFLTKRQVFNPELDFFHPDELDYEPVVNRYETAIADLSEKAFEIQDNIKSYVAKIKRCENYLRSNLKSDWYVKKRYINYGSTYYRYPMQKAENVLAPLFEQYFYPSDGTVLYDLVSYSRSTGYITLGTYKLNNHHQEQILRRMTNRPSINESAMLDPIYKYLDLYSEGVEYLLQSRNYKPVSNSWMVSKFGNRFVANDTTRTNLWGNMDSPYVKGQLAFHQWAKQFLGGSYRTFWNGPKYYRTEWPWTDKYMNRATGAMNAIVDVLKNYINKYHALIKEESKKLEVITAKLSPLQTDMAYYSTLSLFRDNFNKNINNPEFVNFPTLKELEELAKEKNVTLSIAFILYNKELDYQNINFAYPKFVADLAIYNALKDKRVNFNTLSNEEKKYYLVSATAFISEKIYGNDELIKAIEYRMTLIDKYYDTLIAVDQDVVAPKAKKMYESIKKGMPLTSNDLGRSYEWAGFAKDDEDNTMGFFKIGGIDLRVTIPDLKIELPSITIPEINIVNITMPKSINPVEGMLSLLGASDASKAFVNKSMNILVNTPIYVPVLSEAIGVAEDVGQTVEEVGQAVIDAGGQFIEDTGEFIANSPQMVGEIIHALGNIAGEIIKAPFELLDGIAYAILPPDIARKIDTVTDLGADISTGQKVTVEDIREAGQACLKIAIAPMAFTGKISADIIDSAKKNIPLIADLDRYSGGLLTSASNLDRALHDEYEGKGHKPELILDAIKIGLVILTAGTASAVIANVATTVATNVVIDKTGVGGDELKTAVQIYQSGGISTDVIANYAENKAKDEIVKQGAKEVSKATGIPLADVMAVGQGIQSGKSVSQALTDAGKAKAKRDINEEIKKKTGLPITVSDIMSADPSNKKSLVQEIQVYAKNPELLKELVKKETELAIKKERVKMEEKVEQVKKLKESIENFDLQKELTTLQKNANKEIDKRVEDMKNLQKEIENYSSEDLNADMEHLARTEKDKFTKKAYEDFYALRDKYIPQALLDYLMYTYGPKPNYDKYMGDGFDWGNWNLPADGTLFKKNPHKSKFTGLKIAGVALGAYASYKIYES